MSDLEPRRGIDAATTSRRSGVRSARVGVVVAVVVVVGAELAGCRPVSTGAVPASSSSRASASAAPSVRESGEVVSVADGDTVDVMVSGRRVRVRLLGIDAPEVAHDTSPAECGADAAREALDRRVWHREVTLVRDVRADGTDRFGRLLRYVEADGLDVGGAQVAAGLAEAWHPRSAPEPQRSATYEAAEERARAGRVGAWASCARLGRQG